MTFTLFEIEHLLMATGFARRYGQYEDNALKSAIAKLNKARQMLIEGAPTDDEEETIIQRMLFGDDKNTLTIL